MKNNSFELIPITELLCGIVDNRGKSCPTAESGFPLIATNCIKHSSIYPTFENIRYVSEDTRKNWFRVELKPNDILFVNKGTPGRVCLVPDPITFCAAQDMIGLRADPNKIYYKYLFAVLRSDYIQRKIANFHVGIAIPHFKKSDMDNLLIPVPSMDLQYKIGELYCELSEKIENNNAVNAALEAMAKTIYDYWFLQFEFPDENGKPYKSSGGKMVWNEELKRDIPDGWGVIHLGEITNCLDSKRVPLSAKDRETKKGSIPYYGATGIMDYVNEAIFDGDYVLMAEDGSVMDDNGNPILQRISGKVWVNNHAHVLEPSKGHCCKLLMLLLKDVQVLTIKTGSVQMKINQEKMNGIAMPDIPDELLKKANDIFDEIDKQQLHRRNENQELASLRDFLLPLLMNGQVTFKGE